MAFNPDPASLRIEIMRTDNASEYLKRTAILLQPDLPALLAKTKYSREFEAEADDYAFRLLKEKNYSPAAFASVMDRLSKKYEEKMSRLSFISTHPITEERVKKARAAAR